MHKISIISRSISSVFSDAIMVGSSRFRFLSSVFRLFSFLLFFFLSLTFSCSVFSYDSLLKQDYFRCQKDSPF